MPTLTPEFTKGWVMPRTPIYQRTVKVGVQSRNSSGQVENDPKKQPDPNLTILDPTAQPGGFEQTINAIAFWKGEPFQASTTFYQGDYASDNSKGYGITFLTFNNNQFVSKVNLNVGANDSGSADFSDSIFVGTSPKNNGYLGSTTNDMVFSQNTITTAINTNTVGDLVVLGSDKATSGISYQMKIPGVGTQNIAGFIAGTRTPVPTLTMNSNTINTGGGDDSIIFANPLSVLSNNVVNVNGGKDFIYFADAADVKLGNVINLGFGDNSPDSLIFATSTTFNSTGLAAGAMLTVNNFKDGQDVFFYNNKSYTKIGDINALFTGSLSGRIVFNA